VLDSLLKDPNMPVYLGMAIVAVVLFWDKLNPKVQQANAGLVELTKATMAATPSVTAKTATTKEINWQEAACYCRCLQNYLRDDKAATEALKNTVWPAIGAKP
jgi:hypothetical protein